MKKFSSALWIGLLLGVAMGGVAATEAERRSAKKPNGIIVTTAAVALPKKEKARLTIVQAVPRKDRVPVEVLFKDVRGNVLARRRGEIGPDQPLIEELPRAGLRASGALLLQTEVRLGPVSRRDASSCPMHLTFEVLPVDDSHGSTHTCSGLDPCDDYLEGPPSRSHVFPMCVSRPGDLTLPD